jgi:pimeloyl-ACP methyl ester carboxylesterase
MVATTVMFIHGMYMNGTSWAPWRERATARGFDSIAPSWPFHEGEPAALRADVPAGLGSLTFGEVTDELKRVIDGLPERPVLVGHSIGGLLVQKLVNDGFARAGVAISSAPPAGVITLDPVFFRANWPHINPFAGSAPVLMTKERFHFTFCNTMSRAESDAAFDEFVVPESRNVPRSTLTSQGRIDFTRAHVPLLMLTGDSDHLIPVGLARTNAKRYAPAIELREFANRAHFICNENGWEEVADAAFDWIEAL